MTISWIFQQVLKKSYIIHHQRGNYLAIFCQLNLVIDSCFLGVVFFFSILKIQRIGHALIWKSFPEFQEMGSNTFFEEQGPHKHAGIQLHLIHLSLQDTLEQNVNLFQETFYILMSFLLSLLKLDDLLSFYRVLKCNSVSLIT